MTFIPVAICFSNGADQCGLMCVQSILLDRLETDQCLTVPLVVGTIKAIRPQVIPTVVSRWVEIIEYKEGDSPQQITIDIQIENRHTEILKHVEHNIHTNKRTIEVTTDWYITFLLHFVTKRTI